MMTELESQAIEVMELIEDSVEYFCNENVISGEKVWTMVGALADAKLAQFLMIDSNSVEMLTAREQLMWDIDGIVSSAV